MSSPDAIRTLVERVYAALAAGDADALLALLDADFVGTLTDGMPAGAGTHRGPEAMMRDGWWAIGGVFRVLAEPEEWIACADGRLLVSGTYRGTARATGGRVEAAFAHLWTEAGGCLTGLRQWTDTASWHAALIEQEAGHGPV